MSARNPVALWMTIVALLAGFLLIAPLLSVDSPRETVNSHGERRDR